MPKLKANTIRPTVAEDKAITAAARRDPDAKPLSDAQWKATSVKTYIEFLRSKQIEYICKRLAQWNEVNSPEQITERRMKMENNWIDWPSEEGYYWMAGNRSEQNFMSLVKYTAERKDSGDPLGQQETISDRSIRIQGPLLAELKELTPKFCKIEEPTNPFKDSGN